MPNFDATDAKKCRRIYCIKSKVYYTNQGTLFRQAQCKVFSNFPPASEYRKRFKNVIDLLSNDDVTMNESNLFMTDPHSHVTRSISVETNTSKFLNLGTRGSAFISDNDEADDLDKFYNNWMF
jgi:hypothetical protein